MTTAPAPSATTAATACPRCMRPLDHAALHSGVQRCGVCQGIFEATRFDPPSPDTELLRLSEAGPAGAQACAAHAANAAVSNCDRCGVFACGLCRIDLDGRTLCPACFERLAGAGELPGLLRAYRDHYRAQLLLLLLGGLIIFAGVVTGPTSLYFGKRAWQEAAGRTGRRAWIAVLMALALAETALSVFLYVGMVRS